MKVEVHFTTQLRAALGRSRDELAVEPSTTVSGLLELLAKEHPRAFQQFVLDADGRLLPNILICVGDQQVVRPAEHVLQDGDAVTVLSAISGG